MPGARDPEGQGTGHRGMAGSWGAAVLEREPLIFSCTPSMTGL